MMDTGLDFLSVLPAQPLDVFFEVQLNGKKYILYLFRAMSGPVFSAKWELNLERVSISKLYDKGTLVGYLIETPRNYSCHALGVRVFPAKLLNPQKYRELLAENVIVRHRLRCFSVLEHPSGAILLCKFLENIAYSLESI